MAVSTPASLGRQRVLPWHKALEIALMSLQVRFGRSLITSSSIALACAFLAFTVAGHDLLRGLIHLNDADVNFALQRRGIDLEETGASLQAREYWLIATSMIVCLVGVTNALLMSVTERIKEIGTMKCLGALNSFVVKLFLIEALLLGTFSSTTGAIVGMASCVLLYLSLYGHAAVSGAPWIRLCEGVLLTIGLGTVLSILAAIYPSLIAARMQPVDAMRKEV